MVTYGSNGETVQSTFWLDSAFNKSLPTTDSNLNKVSYGLFIDIDFDKQSEYRLEIQKFKDRNWTKMVREFEPFFPLPKSSKFLDVESNFSGFYNEKWNDRYVNMTLDLEDIGLPEKFQVLFYTEQREDCSRSDCKTVKYDFTEWVPIPPPSVSISVQPKYYEIKPGENKTVDVQLNSTADIQQLVEVFGYNQPEIILKYPSNRTLQLDPYGIDTIPLRVERSQSSGLSGQTIYFPIYVNSTISTQEPLELRPDNTNASPRGEEIQIQNETVSNQTHKTVLVLKFLDSPTWYDDVLERLAYINNKVISPISGIWTFLLGVLALGIPWAIRIYRKKGKKYDGSDI